MLKMIWESEVLSLHYLYNIWLDFEKPTIIWCPPAQQVWNVSLINEIPWDYIPIYEKYLKD